jgi:hypothetical protein
MITVIVISVILGVIQLGVHYENKSMGQTRKQRKTTAKRQESNRLLWSIRKLEEEVLGIDWQKR